MERWGPRAVRVAAATALAAVSVAWTAGGAEAVSSTCGLITAGRVNGLTARPAHVTLALSSGYGSTYATVTQCSKGSTGSYAQSWQVAGRVGRNGYAAYGRKREGDGKSPTGVFAVGTAFGASNPGAPTGYLTLTPRSCWNETVGSAAYNSYFVGTCGAADETLYEDVGGAYRQALVIRYNMWPVVQGYGSGIFLHVGTGGATAGCISTPLASVVAAIRAAHPGDVVVMGATGTAIRAATVAVTHTLWVGSGYHSEVVLLQRRLTAWGHPLVQDGQYGPRTKAAVAAFQRKVGLPQTGTADYATEKTLGLR